MVVSTTATTMASSVRGHSCPPPHRAAAAIVGGSLGGLAAAIALRHAGWQQVDVYERAPGPLDKKGSGLGYVNVQAWEALLRGTAAADGGAGRSPQPPPPLMMRRQRRQRRASRQQGSFYYGDLWKYLYQGLPSGTVQFGKNIEELQFLAKDNNNNNNNNNNNSSSTPPPLVTVDGKDYDLVILADGGFSKLRKYVLEEDEKKVDATRTTTTRFQKQPEYAGYIVWRGHVTASAVPKEVLWNIQEGVYKNGIYDTIVLKMAKDNGEDVWTMGTFIATPEEDLVSKYGRWWNKETDGASRQHTTRDNNEACSSSSSPIVPEWFLDHFKTNFQDVPGLVHLIECMIQDGDIHPHPQYEFGAIERVHRGRVILLGDSAHMASPRTAVGAHTAILDALALREAFTTSSSNTNGGGDIMIDEAIELYSQSGIRHAHELYARSRQVSREFVPPADHQTKRRAIVG